MKSMKELLEKAEKFKNNKIAVAVAEDLEVLKSVKLASEKGIALCILIGDENKIKALSLEIDLNLKNQEIIHCLDPIKCCEIAVKLVRKGDATALMKGLVDTSIILKSALNKDWGLHTGSLISHLSVFELEHYNKLLFMTDSAININPSLEDKKMIVRNSLKSLKNIGIKIPKVGVICAKEKVNPKMQSTVDAKELCEEFKDECIIEGPIALDGAVSKEASKIKGIKSEIAGEVDLIVMDNIEAGNALYKSFTCLCNSKNGGVVLGTLKPIILTSRADSAESKIISIALGVLS